MQIKSTSEEGGGQAGGVSNLHVRTVAGKFLDQSKSCAFSMHFVKPVHRTNHYLSS